MATPVSITRDSSQTDRAILGIRDLVLRGEFKGGERLAEVELAERIGVSRTPIRAALQKLEEEGLLELAQPTGYIVRRFTETDLDDAIEVRGTIEALAARLAAERGTSRVVLGQMRECLAEIDAVLAEKMVDLEHLNRYAAANARFHQLMLEAAGSEIIERSLKRVVSLPFASPSAFVLAQSKIPDAFDLLKIAQAQHHDIVDAIGARAGARAEALVKEHARIARKNLELALLHADALDYVVGGSLIRRYADDGR
ncbi:GntR family transcriptional regulator [Noviherbaspirillum cavernae]|uniref:GntR family transcriptional regulator n=1 Tax=Noviherbaspirillum cavernae TaxID=2320862 RepID=A0A418WW81_9BURK|nr:GntR family transcriptional regulator [Noviherbaspirillum cavernae]RJF96923.1 GntR family transcriptional regulator [Noviherbaspirillum cavernae]